MTLSPERQRLLALLEKEKKETSRFGRIGRRRDLLSHPTTYSQELAWYIQQFGQCGFDHPSIALWLEGTLDVPLLQRSIAAVVQRHEVLRASFEQIDGRVVQRIRPDAETPLEVLDLSELPEESRRARALELARTKDEQAFDLTRDPMVRPLLVRLADREHLLAIIVHHVAFDGYSIPSFLEELWALYDAAVRGEDLELPEPRIQLADYADWQRRFVKSPAGVKQVGYWRRKLAGAQPLRLFADGPEPELSEDHLPFARHYPCHGTSASATPALIESVRARAKEERASTYMMLLAALAIALERRCRQQDISVFSPYSHRDRDETKKLIGYAANPLVMRIDLGGDPTLREVLARARSTALEAFSNPDIPLGYGRDVHVDLGFDAIARPGLFQVSLNYLPIGLTLAAPRTLSASETHWPSDRTRIDLVFFVEEGREQLQFFALCNAQRFSEETLRSMTDQLIESLQLLVDSPERRISTVR